MYLLFMYPLCLLSWFILLIAPAIGAMLAFSSIKAKGLEDKDKVRAQVIKGITIGLLIDIPLICLALYFGSAM